MISGRPSCCAAVGPMPDDTRSRPSGETGAAVTEDLADLESFDMVPEAGDNGADRAPAGYRTSPVKRPFAVDGERARVVAG